MSVKVAEQVSAASTGWRLEAIGAQWQRVKRFAVFLLPLRFSVLALAVTAFALVFSNQGHDVIAAIVEDDPSGIAVHRMQRWFFVPLVTLLTVQVWYWSRQLLRIRFDITGPQARDYPWCTKQLPRLLGVAAYVIAIAAVASVVRRQADETAAMATSRATSLIIGLTIAAALFYAFCSARRRLLDRWNKAAATEQASSATELPHSTRVVLGATAVLAVVFFLSATLFVQRTGHLGSGAILLLSASLWVPFGSMLVYLGGRLRIPLLTALIVLACLVSPFNDNHVVPALDSRLPERQTVTERFVAWYDALGRERPNAPHPVFIAAAEGGGIRAAYWAAAVLGTLADDVPGFREHLFAVSGVSGGSLGAGVYTALLAAQAESAGLVPDQLRSAAARVLAHDALAPTLAAMLQPDLVQRFLPVPFLPDRARALEGGWED